MTNDSEKLANLLAYAQTDGRVCPQPNRSKELWEMLPAKQRVGGNWKPALPLILGGWWHTGELEKQFRLVEQVGYADQHGALDAVDLFLRSLASED